MEVVVAISVSHILLTLDLIHPSPVLRQSPPTHLVNLGALVDQVPAYFHVIASRCPM